MQGYHFLSQPWARILTGAPLLEHTTQGPGRLLPQVCAAREEAQRALPAAPQPGVRLHLRARSPVRTL